ncbi:MAG: hypothetical protein ACT4PO_07965 [Actinomycetota bacterium]
MKLLRRVLYWQAAVWAVSGIALAALPKLLLLTVFDQAHYPEYAWIRIAGIQAIALAAFAVLVAQRLEDLWWFSWVFVIANAAVVTIDVLNAVFGLPSRISSLLWWLSAALAATFTAGLLWGMAKAGQERPFPDS